MVFYGAPGTGKTTVARLIGQIYRSLGVLPKGHCIETDRAGLVAGYVGQTAIKTTEVLNKALGGVLFIDEAYPLTPKGDREDPFGQEAVDTLLKFMEDHRKELVVIVAGYTEEMNRFITSNPGLQSRFPNYLFFDDYTPAQLTHIFRTLCEDSDYSLGPEAEQKLMAVFADAYAHRDHTFSNARFVRNLFEKSLSNQASRLVTVAAPNRETLLEISALDIP